MIQYFLGRKRTKLHGTDPSKRLKNQVFSNERVYSTEEEPAKYNNLVINHSTFANMGFRYNQFKDCDFQHCVFIDCYFKDAQFSHVKFTACKFIKCNFDDAVIHRCDFDYATFNDCYIAFDAIYFNLPTENNLRWKLAINLGLECLRAGDSREYRKYFFEEMKSSQKYYWELIWKHGDYYKKYSLLDRVKGIACFIGSKLSSFIWGYGEKLQNVVFVAIAMITLFALFFYSQGTVYKSNDMIISMTLAQAFYHSLCSFFTMSSEISSPLSHAARVAVPLEGGVGVTLMGFFVASIFRYVNRR